LEKEVLGALIRYPETVARFRDVVASFYSPDHREYGRELLSRLDSGRSTDGMMLADAIPASVLNELLDAASTPAMLARQVAELEEHARLRHIIATAKACVEMARSGNHTSAELTSRLQEVLTSVPRSPKTLPRPYKLAEILATQFPPKVWALDGIVRDDRPGVVFIIANAGANKTFSAMTITDARMRGADLAGKAVRIASGNVAEIYAETDMEVIKERRLAINAGIHESADRFPLVYPAESPVNLLLDDVYEDFMRLVEANNVSDIVVDSIAECFPGIEIGSGQADLTPITHRLRDMATRGRNRLVWCIHWIKKPPDDTKNITLSDLFGGPGLRYSPETVIGIDRRGPLRRFEVLKSRDGATGVEWWANVDAKTGALTATDAPEKKTAHAHTRREAILSVVSAQEPVSKEAIVQAMRELGYEDKEKVLTADCTFLIKAGRLVKTGGTRDTVYSMAEGK